MKEFTEKLIEALENPNNSEETKELIRNLLRQQTTHVNELVHLINDALNKR